MLLLFFFAQWYAERWHGLPAKLDWRPKVGGQREISQETEETSFVRNCESETLQVSTVAVGHVIKWGCRTAVTGAASTPGSHQCCAVRHGATLPVVEFISALGLPCFYAHAVQLSLPPPTATQQMATSGLKGLMRHRLLAVRLNVYLQHYYHSAILPSNSKVPRGASVQPLRGQWLFRLF